MATVNSKVYDRTSREILAALQENARITWADLGRRVGLSAPAVAERVKRLEESGILCGYRAEVHLEHEVTAFVRVQTPADRYPQLLRLIKREAAVTEAHHVTGAEAFLCKVHLASLPALDALLNRLGVFGETTTHIVLSTPIQRSPRLPEP